MDKLGGLQEAIALARQEAKLSETVLNFRNSVPIWKNCACVNIVPCKRLNLCACLAPEHGA